jgi:hypothetical protein
MRYKGELKCDNCGRVIHAIGTRVSELVIKLERMHFNPGDCKHLKGQISIGNTGGAVAVRCQSDFTEEKFRRLEESYEKRFR